MQATDVVVALDQRYERTPDGVVWTQATHPYSFFTRYLEVFRRVKAVARVRDVPRLDGDWLRVEGPGVQVHPLPHYRGPRQYILSALRVHRAAQRALRPSDTVILRVPSTIGHYLGRHCLKNHRPFALEVVGDPYEIFSPRATRHVLRPLFRALFTRNLRRLCGSATAVSYVTREALQRRYPPAQEAFATHYSSIQLGSDAFARPPRCTGKRASPVTLINVGQMANCNKGIDTLLRAFAICRRRGLAARLVLVGDGRQRPSLQREAHALGVSQHTEFVGQLACGRAVREQLDRADLFVLPSRQEGLPRALIEAMARGLPCVASTVGGIGELLSASELVRPNDARSLAGRIMDVLGDAPRRERLSAENLARAQAYHEARLRVRRDEFYRHVKVATGKGVRSLFHPRLRATNGHCPEKAPAPFFGDHKTHTKTRAA